ncbi:hypothetical protein [Streptomyces sp. NPDC046939]|uniref:hypothetical protein n=1 Tax=Streptomyces sp. NPDC046939 TaxID=3155376 RepID=UPI0033D7EE47
MASRGVREECSVLIMPERRTPTMELLALAAAAREMSVRAAEQPGLAGPAYWYGGPVDAHRVALRSRQGIQMAPAFRGIVAGAVQIPEATALNGELIVWDNAGRLAFGWRQHRLAPPRRCCHPRPESSRHTTSPLVCCA